MGLAIGAFVTFIITLNYYRKGLDKRSQALAEEKREAKAEAQKALEDAERSAETRKRELLIKAKEELNQAKLDLDCEVRERRHDLREEANRLQQENEQVKKLNKELNRRQQNLDKRQDSLDEREDKLVHAEQEKRAELERIADLSREEAEVKVMEQAEEDMRHDMAVLFRNLEEETRDRADKEAKEIVVASIQRYASDYVSDATVSVVALPNEEMKGRIIGREGRNIRTIESLTGVDLIIDDTPEAVILSSFDPIRREIARMAIEKLVFDGRIHPARIEEMVGKAEKEIDQSIKEAGEQAVFDTGVVGLKPEIIRYLGRMKYRTSYGQNVLQHSIEVSKLAGYMAGDLGLDVELAKRAGLLHDLGKSIDFEVEGTHSQLGAMIARKYHEQDAVVNAIESHHGDVEVKYLISSLVAAADAISAARPGARHENIETYIKRIEKLEEIANSFDGVEKSYAIQAGREIRVMVQPDHVKDDDMILLTRAMTKKIEQELNYPGQIKVQLIRESRAVDYAK